MLLPCPPCIALECAQRSPCLACAGLDEAILGNLGNGGSDSGGGGGGNPEEDSRKIADLLKHGAHEGLALGDQHAWTFIRDTDSH